MESTDRTHESGRRNPLWQRIHELSLLEPEEHQQFEHLYLWFLSQGALSVHALRYCTVCVQVLGSLNVRDIAAAIWHPPSSGGSAFNARVVDLFKFAVVDEARILHSLFGVLGEADHRSVSLASRQVSSDHRLSRASSVEAPLSHRGSSAGAIGSVDLSLNREASGPSAHISLYATPREVSGAALDEVLLSSSVSAADLLLATVASPLTIQTRLAYLFAFPAHRHCFSTTLLQRHRVGSLHDEHQGQGLTGLLLAPHCGKRFYTHDVGLFQHLPRLRAAAAATDATARPPPPPTPPVSSSSAAARQRYHPYYQAYDFDFAEPSLVRASQFPAQSSAATEAQSLPPDARCVASDAEAWRLLSPSDPDCRDVGLAGLLSHIQIQHQQHEMQRTSVAAGVCFNEVGAIVRRPEDIVGVFYYIQPAYATSEYGRRTLDDARRQAQEVALQFGLRLFHLQIHKATTPTTVAAGADWVADADSVA